MFNNNIISFNYKWKEKTPPFCFRAMDNFLFDLELSKKFARMPKSIFLKHTFGKFRSSRVPP